MTPLGAVPVVVVVRRDDRVERVAGDERRTLAHRMAREFTRLHVQRAVVVGKVGGVVAQCDALQRVRRREPRIERDRLVRERDRALQAVARAAGTLRLPGADVGEERRRIDRLVPERLQHLPGEVQRQVPADGLGNRGVQPEHVVALGREPIGKHHPIFQRVDDPDVDAPVRTGGVDAAFDEVADAEFRRQFVGALPGLGEGARRGPGQNAELVQWRHGKSIEDFRTYRVTDEGAVAAARAAKLEGQHQQSGGARCRRGLGAIAGGSRSIVEPRLQLMRPGEYRMAGAGNVTHGQATRVCPSLGGADIAPQEPPYRLPAVDTL